MLSRLEELPGFETYPFDGKSDVQIYEIALITYKTTPQTEPPYQRQEVVGVVGRDVNPSKRLFASREWMRRENGTVMAIHGDATRDVLIQMIERYEVIIPQTELRLLRTTRRV